MSQFSSTDPYIVLGLPLTATVQDVKKARNTLQRRFHADVNKDPGALKISTAINVAATELINKLEKQPTPTSAGDERQEPEQSGNRGQRRQRSNRGQRRERQRGRGRGEQPTAEPQPEKDPAAVKAQALYAASLDQVYAILYSPDTKRMAEDGVTEEKIKDLSYAARIRATANDALGFNYNVKPPTPTQGLDKGQGKKKRRERPYKKVAANQDIEEHEEAFDQLWLLVADRFDNIKTRLEAVLTEVNTAATDFGDADAVLKAKVGQPGSREAGQPLETKLLRYKTQLEWKRVDAIRDATDWFGARVGQIERAMQQLSARTEEEETITNRIAKVFVDAEFNKHVDLVRKDLEWFESLTNLQIDCPEQDKPVIERVIKIQVERAKRAVAKFDSQRAFFIKLDTLDAETKLNPIDTIKERVQRIMLGNPIAEDFIREADNRLIGLSPDQELNFWSAVLDLFDEVEEQPDRELKGEDLRAARLARITKINEVLGISTEVGGRRQLLNPDDKVAPSDDSVLPYGFGQVVERCRKDAVLLVELKKALWKTNAILGPNTKKEITRIMRGHPNQEKLEAISGPDERSGFNGLISKKQLEAVRILGQLPKEPKADATDEEAAAYTVQKTAAEAFTAALAGRKVQDLKWRNETDRPLIKQIRIKLHELLEIGTMDEPDAEALEELLFPEPEEAKGKKPEVVVVPWADEIFGKRLPAELFVDADGEATGITADHVRTALKEYSGRLVQTFRVGEKDQVAGGLNREIFKQFKLIQPDELNFGSLNKFMETIQLFVEACEQCKVHFGVNWVTEFQLVLPPSADGGKPEPDLSHIVQLMEGIKGGQQPLAALLELGKAAGVDTSVLEPAEPDASEPTRVLVEQMFNGTVDAAVITEAYPHIEEKKDPTPEIIKAALEEDLATIEQVSRSAALREAVVRLLYWVVPEGSTAVETVPMAVAKLDLLAKAFVGMKTVFGETWATDCGLINNQDPELEPYVDETLLRNGLKAFAEGDDALDSFWFDTVPVARERLLNHLDGALKERFAKLQISAADQLMVLLECVPRKPGEQRPQLNQAFGRLAKLLEFGNMDKAGQPKKTGRELLRKLHLIELDEAEDVIYQIAQIKEAINNESFDD
ncbi:MAG: hypothetical protein HY565_04620 [Candidatus Kerfeldbacteria bacterium]|nr:hypothetical protein [Candidatus Kerfeldbacteria bacterium]